jgi:UDP-glucose 4-epimerase
MRISCRPELRYYVAGLIGWKMLDGIGRVYDNQSARRYLDWNPKYSFPYILECLKQNRPWQSELAIAVGAKGYHSDIYKDGPYPV